MTVLDKLDRKCIFLGLRNDPDTCLDYPSRLNYCHKSQPLSIVSLEHQEKVCSVLAHVDCPLFGQPEKAPMPPEMCGSSNQPVRQRKSSGRVILNILGVIAVIVTFSFGIKAILPPFVELQQDSPQNLSTQGISEAAVAMPSSTKPATPTPTDIVIPTATLTPTASSTPSLTPTFTSSPSATASKIARKVRTLDTEFGLEFKFVIHRMGPGESLALYAQKYSTTVEAIQAINYNLVFPLWENTVVIIPIGFDDVRDLPKFQAFMVENDGLSIEEVARTQASDPALIKKYNNLGDDYRSLSGDWLIIPRIDGTPTP